MVGISLLTLVPGVLGGSETYARELVRGLARVGRHEYRVFVPAIAQDAADGLPGRTVSSYRARTSLAGRGVAMASGFARPGRLRREIAPDELEALHFPLTVVLPPLERPIATTVLDLQHELFPQYFSRAELAYRRVFYRSAVRRSRLVIAISTDVKATIVERLGIEPARVRVAPLGVDLERFSPGHGERRPFLLYPANAWPHKNHERLFGAFELVRRKRPELRLVLTGTGHEKLSLPPGAESRGRVSEDELVELYRKAEALVFPSLYEGFGLPPLEAMACACPVAVSRAGALPDVCGDAARYFDPTSVEEITEAILSPPGGEAGPARAALFTWDECARRHDDAYDDLIRVGP
jgi:glycosyltransferase involved in cell wall biosynthesis